jgi:hypothetical protein
VALAAGVPREKVTVDPQHQRAVAAAAPLPGAELATYYALERRTEATAEGWTIEIIPPASALPVIEFANDDDQLNDRARMAVEQSAWAALRWNVPVLSVPGLPQDGSATNLPLAARRAVAIAAALKEQGVGALPSPAAGPSFRLGTPEAR